MFENKHSVSMKSRRRFLHLSSFSDSNSFMMAGPGLYTKQNDLDHDLDDIDLDCDREDAPILFTWTFIIQYNNACHVCVHC